LLRYLGEMVLRHNTRSWFEGGDFNSTEFVESRGSEFKIATALLNARLSKKWSQTRLAREAGTTQTSISYLESGRYVPSLSLLKRVAEALDLEIMVSFREKSKAMEFEDIEKSEFFNLI